MITTIWTISFLINITVDVQIANMVCYNNIIYIDKLLPFPGYREPMESAHVAGSERIMQGNHSPGQISLRFKITQQSIKSFCQLSFCSQMIEEVLSPLPSPMTVGEVELAAMTGVEKRFHVMYMPDQTIIL